MQAAPCPTQSQKQPLEARHSSHLNDSPDFRPPHLLACPWGSIMRGHRRAWDVMRALSMLKASLGSPSSSLGHGKAKWCIAQLGTESVC